MRQSVLVALCLTALVALVLVSPEPGPAGANPLMGATAVAAGAHHSCAVTQAGTVMCWGRNDYGQLGDGTSTPHTVPVVAGALAEPASAVDASAYSTCAITVSTALKCWGANSYAVLGDGTIDTRLSPVTVVGLSSGAASVTGFYYHRCAITASGGLKCWGDNRRGKSGTGYCDMCLALVPADVIGLSTGVSDVDVAIYHSCALTTGGTVKCWGGTNVYGYLGLGTTDFDPHPVPEDAPGLGSNVSDVSVGGYHSCAVLAGGVKCWGWNHYGQLGVPPALPGCNPYAAAEACSPSPVDVSGLSEPVTAVEVGTEHTCALTVDGGVKCWGSNEYGQLGNGTTSDSSMPVDVLEGPSGPPLTDIVALAAGYYHTCAVTAAGEVKCWGENTDGQLGAVATEVCDGEACSTTAVSVVIPQPGADSDSDGCLDEGEAGPSQQAGGQRNPKFFWDFFDVPTPPGFARDRSVTIGDAVAVIARFGSYRNPPPSESAALAEALSPPPSAPAYHTGYDRTLVGPNAWNTGPPNGSVTIEDIVRVIAQFGHNCA